MNNIYRFLFFIILIIIISLFYLAVKDKSLAIICELIIVASTFYLLKNWLIKITISLPILTILASQFTSAYAIGDYLPILAFSNINESTSINLQKSLFIFSSALFANLIFVYSFYKLFSCNLLKMKKHLLIVVIIIVLACVSYLLKSPTTTFVKNAFSAYKELSFEINYDIKTSQKKLYEKNFVYKNLKNPLPQLDQTKKLNIIVFFVEGFNFESIDLFNDKYDDLTPNIDKFINSSVYFSNYYNHTAATFRGIRGQLTSSYQSKGGYYKDNSGLGQLTDSELNQFYKDTVISLPHIMNTNGYSTAFFEPHDEQQFHNMLINLDFKTVYGTKDFIGSRSSVGHLSDTELFSLFTKTLQENKIKNPFFIGFYNVGTHLGLDSSNVKYKINNEVANTIHNFDFEFGKFFSWFKSSKYHENTIIILTADHSAFPSNKYIELFGNKGLTKDIMINKIPLAIYYKNFKHQVLDAQGKNSIDFAPTVLSILGINKAHNYFLGCSIFETNCTLPFEFIHNQGDIFMNTKNGDIINMPHKDPNIKLIEDYYSLSGI